MICVARSLVAVVGGSAMLLAMVLATAAMAADEPKPVEGKSEKPSWLSVNIPMEVQNDYNYRSGVPGGKVNNLSFKLEPEATLNVLSVPGLSFYIHTDIEQVADADPHEDRYFKDEGFYVEDLFVKYETGRFSFRGGKMNPGFGIAWDQTPGIYGTDMAEDYEMSERIALSANVAFEPDGLGSHSVTAGTFFMDTSPLHDTIFSRTRGTLGREDGGVSNTGDFSSFNVVLEGGKFPAVPDLAYHLAYIRQAHGRDGTTDETGYAAALTTKVDLGRGFMLTPLFEVALFDDLGGMKGADRQYWTGSALTEWHGWNLAGAYTRRRTDTPGTAAVNDYQMQFSAGYTFDFGLTADLGWKRLKESGEFTDTVGFLFTYALGFTR